MTTKFIVFLDLDGVLVNMHDGLQQKTGFTFPRERSVENKVKIHKMWLDLARDHKTFWIDLEPMDRYMEIYDAAKELHATPFVLSATPENYDFGVLHRLCKDQKKAWTVKHIGDHMHSKTFITKSKLKQEWVGMEGDDYQYVLVDDHPGNIKRWKKAGGIGIHHTDVDTTLEALKGLKAE